MAVDRDQSLQPPHLEALDTAVLDVFAVDADGALVPIGPDIADTVLDLRAVAHDVVDILREVRARPGYRLGAGTDRVRRRGHREEVSQPVLVRPGAAHRAVVTGRLFADPIPALEVDAESRTLDGDSYTWNATLRPGRFARRRAAALYLHPTPSANLSVVELIPSARRRLVARKRFVKRGVAAVDTIGRRLSRLSATA